ncbi:hypothetical protein Y032_0005g2383 [Ancylostoma ceylanicum]|uniref:Uncharacterized protein n=1 Tax=Ancylostoma ceylanicum TaxID=53326 RepID=A0A016VSI7_9BILA|nr:hypothetical protein Y032_0005g2383 [Ancylostoma ceylanicum]
MVRGTPTRSDNKLCMSMLFGIRRVGFRRGSIRTFVVGSDSDVYSAYIPRWATAAPHATLRGLLLAAFQLPTMININKTHPMQLPASIIYRRSAGQLLEHRQQGATLGPCIEEPAPIPPAVISGCGG